MAALPDGNPFSPIERDTSPSRCVHRRSIQVARRERPNLHLILHTSETTSGKRCCDTSCRPASARSTTGGIAATLCSRTCSSGCVGSYQPHQRCPIPIPWPILHRLSDVRRVNGREIDQATVTISLSSLPLAVWPPELGDKCLDVRSQ